MHNFPFLPTRSCMSEAWRSALVNQGFLQQQDPIRPRWRPKGQLWGRARGIQALCWTPEETAGPVQEKVQRAEPRGKQELCEDAIMPLHLVLTSTHHQELTSTHPCDGLAHTSFNNLSPTRTHISLSVSLHRSFRGRGERGMLMKSGTGPRNAIKPPHLQERRNRPSNFTMMMSACLHDSVWLRCQVSPLSLCFFFSFFSFPPFYCLFCSL